MTIGQIFSYVGWTLFSIAILFTILHTINLVVPHVDFLISSSHLGIKAYFVSVPAILIGLVLGIIGACGERFEEWLANRGRRK